jgi:hypothetical protein
MSAWLSDNEKYALITLEVRVDEGIPLRDFAPGYWAWSDAPIALPGHWREWLGTIQSEAIERGDLVLLCKIASKTPTVLDTENEILKRRVWGFYVGLLLSSTFTLGHPPMQLTGALREGVLDVLQQSSLDPSSSGLIRRFPTIRAGQVEQAARLGCAQERLIASPPPRGAWRLFRALTRERGEKMRDASSTCS